MGSESGDDLKFQMPKDGFDKLSEICKTFTCIGCQKHPLGSIDVNMQKGELGTRGVWHCPHCNMENITNEGETELLFRTLGLRFTF